MTYPAVHLSPEERDEYRTLLTEAIMREERAWQKHWTTAQDLGKRAEAVEAEADRLRKAQSEEIRAAEDCVRRSGRFQRIARVFLGQELPLPVEREQGGGEQQQPSQPSPSAWGSQPSAWGAQPPQPSPSAWGAPSDPPAPVARPYVTGQSRAETCHTCGEPAAWDEENGLHHLTDGTPAGGLCKRQQEVTA